MYTNALIGCVAMHKNRCGQLIATIMFYEMPYTSISSMLSDLIMKM